MIQIPGYRLLRPLGRGGMATVHLAIQQSVDREVALKIMSPALLADPNFGERFLREARIAARLHHRHVVGIHDVGLVGEHHYIAMELLAGGALLNGDGQPRGLAFSLRIVREVAEALAYVHDHGFVHRDVKSDNILLRKDGSAALTDFGIARANDLSGGATRTVVGTPHYMSPEQARSQPVDGRADLYSLGIVLHELLTGQVPYNADDSVAIGIRHISDPLPRLPATLAVAQPLLDRLLAKNPADRFQTGRDVIAAITSLEQGRSAAAVSPVMTARTLDTNAELAINERIQPSMGPVDELGRDELIGRAPSRREDRGEPRRPRNTGLLIAAAVALAVLAGLWINQDRLRALVPETELNRLLAQGQLALVDDRISGAPDAALESFRRARELEQDNEVARTGLAEVADRLLDQGRNALAGNDLVGARLALANVRDLRGGGAAIDELTRRIAVAESGRDTQEDLLATAEAALADGRITGGDGAVAAYRKLQANDRGSAIARAGLLKAADALARQAQAALALDDLATAASRIDDIAGVLPDYPGLADLRGQLTTARDRQKSDDAGLLIGAQQRLRAGVVSEGDDSALALYRRVLARDAGNAEARDGLRRVAQALLVRADAAIEDRDIEQATRLLAEATSLAPQSPDLQQAQRRLRDLRESRDIDAQRPPLGSAELDQVQRLVERGDAAAQQGALMDPPRFSAYDHYREALAIDPSNAAALRGIASLPGLAGRRYDDRYSAGDLSAAAAELEILRQLAPADPGLARRSAKLLQACMDRAATLIGERRRADAQRDLTLARRLDPNHPGLPGLEREVAILPPGS